MNTIVTPIDSTVDQLGWPHPTHFMDGIVRVQGDTSGTPFFSITEGQAMTALDLEIEITSRNVNAWLNRGHAPTLATLVAGMTNQHRNYKVHAIRLECNEDRAHLYGWMEMHTCGAVVAVGNTYRAPRATTPT